MREPATARTVRQAPLSRGGGTALRIAPAALAGLVLMQAARLTGLAGDAADWLTGAGLFLAGCAVTAEGIRRSYPHSRLGWCNVVTLLRLSISCALLPPLLAGHPGGWVLAGWAGVALLLDGLDGWLARSSGLVSRFGGRFDIEADSVLALALALHAVLLHPGPEVLLLGLFRYAFVAAGLIWPWLSAPLLESRRRKLICILQLAVLILLQIPQFPASLAAGGIRLALLALLWSFGADILWLWRSRG